MADMLIIFSSFLVYLGIAILSISIILLYQLFLGKQNHHGPAAGGELKLPPGNTAWPVIGENLQFAISNSRGNPEKFINDRTSKHKSDNVFQTSLFGEKMAVFCGPAANKFIFSNEEKYVRSWWPSSVKRLTDAVTRYVDDTKYTRRSIHEYVKPEALQNYVPVIDSMAKQHLEKEWCQKEVVKAFPLIKKFTYAVACRLFMNIEDPHQVAKLARPFETFSEGIISVPLNFPGTAFNKAMNAGKSIQKELMGIIRQREKVMVENKEQGAAGGEDMLTRMLVSEEHDNNDRFSKESYIANSITALFIGSNHTTSSAISTTIRYLAEVPNVYDLVFKEQMEIASSKGPNEFLNWGDIQKMKYSWMVACEAMRLLPPATGSFREVIADVTFAGFTIPKGWKTFWTVTSTHKNPKYFPDPDRFDPSRFEGTGPAPFTYVPFGGGPRMCPGKDYAKVQILVFIHNLVIKYKWTKVIPDEKITFTTAAIPVNGFPLRIELRI